MGSRGCRLKPELRPTGRRYPHTRAAHEGELLDRGKDERLPSRGPSLDDSLSWESSTTNRLYSPVRPYLSLVSTSTKASSITDFDQIPDRSDEDRFEAPANVGEIDVAFFPRIRHRDAHGHALPSFTFRSDLEENIDTRFLPVQ